MLTKRSTLAFRRRTHCSPSVSCTVPLNSQISFLGQVCVKPAGRITVLAHRLVTRNSWQLSLGICLFCLLFGCADSMKLVWSLTALVPQPTMTGTGARIPKERILLKGKCNTVFYGQQWERQMTKANGAAHNSLNSSSETSRTWHMQCPFCTHTQKHNFSSAINQTMHNKSFIHKNNA